MVRIALLLAAATLAAPAATAGEGEWQLFFTERESAFHASGVVAEGETRGYRFVVAQPNVTSVEFALAWTETGDPAGLSGPDVLSLAAADPAGRPVGAPARSATGEARVVASRIAPLPPGGPADEEEVERRLAEAASTRGQGEWRASVKLEDAGNPAGAKVDEGNAYSLVVTVRFYEAVPMRVVALGKPGSPLAASPADPWLLSAGALGLVALALGGVIARQARRRRRVAPGGDNTPSGPR